MSFDRMTTAVRNGLCRRWLLALLSVGPMLGLNPALASDEEKVSAELGARYEREVKPIVQQYCWKCHSGEDAEGEIDLPKFQTLNDVRHEIKTWQKVVDVLEKGEMPPKNAKQPSAEARQKVKEWIGSWLTVEARNLAGDPGLVLLRRLNNVEYTNTVRDLTGADLKPAREFPIDGAAGEGFTNTGESLVMSPALLTKYLDAAKEIASHVVFLPDGFRFSDSVSRRDWTDALINEIRNLYAKYADKDGKIPLEAYLSATLELREAEKTGRPVDVAAVAKAKKLSAKYLGSLWDLFRGQSGGTLIAALRDQWRAMKAEEVSGLAAAIRQWQVVSWKFNPVGSAFNTPWQQPISPIVTSQTLRQKLQPAPGAADVTLYLAAGDGGDGADQDTVIWNAPRLEIPGQPSLLLRDLRTLSQNLLVRRKQVLGDTSRYLTAAADTPRGADASQIAEVAKRYGLEKDALGAWLEYLGVTRLAPIPSEQYFRETIPRDGGYAAIRGWSSGELPSIVANSTDQGMQIPGTLKAHGVAVHPSPTLAVGVGWRSPLAGRVRVSGKALDAHAACGNGFTWSLELRRRVGGGMPLAGGALDEGKEANIKGLDDLAVEPGDIVALIIGPRDGNHGCDLTEIELEVTPVAEEKRRWRLTDDVANDILAGNPHADRQGNLGIWHFFSEPASGTNSAKPVIPQGSVLARWLDANTPDEKKQIADDVQRLLTSPTAPAETKEADLAFHRQAISLSGPLLGRLDGMLRPEKSDETVDGSRFGLDPALFGKRPNGKGIDPSSLAVKAPSVLEIRIPADLAAGREFVVTGTLDPEAGTNGSAQVRLATSPITPASGLIAGQPVVTADQSPAQKRMQEALGEFQRWFPAALCFRQIVPVDEVVTVIQLFRDDQQLGRLMLEDQERARLDRLWEELHYVSQDALRMYQSFDQMLGFASQENGTATVEGWRKPITAWYEAFQKVQAESEPKHLANLVRWTERAYRRPLTDQERAEIPALYQQLRSEKLSHEDAFRLVLARVLVSPAFLYRAERPGSGSGTKPLNDWELASRLSYFLWSTMPDDSLKEAAGTGRLHESDGLATEAKRMVRDGRVRALATEFACQWLDIKDFDSLEEKSERHFPTFAQVRGDLYEESIRYFVDLFQRDGSILELIDSDHTFLNEPLANFYGIPGVTGPEWRRVDGVKKYGRGGVLGLGATLAKQSGASRTSPILRGNWILESVLGERLPKPPKGVPQLPEDESTTEGMTVRQLVEKHRASVQCSGCHNRIDPFGFALEGFDAVGRRRLKDLANRPVDVRAELLDGTKFEDIAGLRDYVLTQKKERFVRNFCRKLTGYALGRAVQLSDEPLIDEMLVQLKAGDYRVSIALEAIVRSKPFREHRGLTEVAER